MALAARVPPGRGIPEMELPMRRILTCLLLALMLSACATVDTTIILRPNLSGTLTQHVSVEAHALALAREKIRLDDYARQSKANGATVHQWVEGDFQHLEITYAFADLTELRARLSPLFDQTKITFMDDKLNVLLTKAPDAQLESNALAAALLDTRFTLYPPGTVLSTNGTPNEDASAYSWSFSLAEPIRIQLNAYVPPATSAVDPIAGIPPYQLGIALLSIAAVIGATGTITLWRGRKTKKPDPYTLKPTREQHGNDNCVL